MVGMLGFVWLAVPKLCDRCICFLLYRTSKYETSSISILLLTVLALRPNRFSWRQSIIYWRMLLIELYCHFSFSKEFFPVRFYLYRLLKYYLDFQQSVLDVVFLLKFLYFVKFPLFLVRFISIPFYSQRIFYFSCFSEIIGKKKLKNVVLLQRMILILYLMLGVLSVEYLIFLQFLFQLLVPQTVCFMGRSSDFFQSHRIRLLEVPEVL